MNDQQKPPWASMPDVELPEGVCRDMDGLSDCLLPGAFTSPWKVAWGPGGPPGRPFAVGDFTVFECVAERRDGLVALVWCRDPFNKLVCDDGTANPLFHTTVAPSGVDEARRKVREAFCAHWGVRNDDGTWRDRQPLL